MPIHSLHLLHLFKDKFSQLNLLTHTKEKTTQPERTQTKHTDSNA